MVGEMMARGDDEDATFAEKLGQLLHDVNAVLPSVTIEYRDMSVVRPPASCSLPLSF